jgi:4-carboxymuconolactone decarboxylase
MSRLPDLDRDRLSPQQAALFDAIAATPRGAGMALEGPFGVWMHSPALGEAAQRLGEQVRYHSALPPRLSELAILVCARHWRADYEWHVHAPIALRAGITEAAVAAIRAGGEPPLTAEDEAVVHAFTAALLRTRRAPDGLYQRASALLGERTVVDLTVLVGYYSLVALTLNAFEVEAAEAVDWGGPE